MSTPHFSLPRESIDARHLSTVRKCRCSTLRYGALSIDSPHLFTVHKCRRPTLRYRVRVSTPHTSLPCTNIDAPLSVTTHEYRLPTILYCAQISTLNTSLPCAVSTEVIFCRILYPFFFRKWGGEEAVICSFGPVDESLFIRSNSVYLHVVLDSFEVVLKPCRFVHTRLKTKSILEI